MLAISCSRLIDGQATDPYYIQAVPLLEQTSRRVKILLSQELQHGWLRDLLLEDYCCLALCHAKAGQTAKARQTSDDCAGVLRAPRDAEQDEPEFAVDHAAKLLAAGQLLREARQPAAARRLTYEAAALCSRLAAYPSHELSFLHVLGDAATICSALANQLGEAALALQQADLARRIFEERMRAAPDDVRHDNSLSAAWERTGKARWSLGQRDRALAAFRESAAIQKRILEREPSNYVSRVRSSQCYNRLAYYSSSAGDLRAAADAILARIRLWPDNTQQLAKSADDFADLAQQVTTRARGHLSAEDRAERDRYLAESRRIRQAAEALTRRVGHELRVER